MAEAKNKSSDGEAQLSSFYFPVQNRVIEAESYEKAVEKLEAEQKKDEEDK